jgi:hypothetical protein
MLSKRSKNRRLSVRRVLAAFVATAALWTAADEAQSGGSIERLSIEQLRDFIEKERTPRGVLFITTNCRACKEAMSRLARVYRKFGDQPPNLIAVSVNPGGPDAMREVIDRLGVPFPVYWVGEKAIDEYRLFGVPMLLLIKRGDILERIPGPQSEAFFERSITRLRSP